VTLVTYRGGTTKIPAGQDCVVVDSPPATEPLAQQVLRKADGVLVCCLADTLAPNTLPMATRAVREARQHAESLELLGIVVGMFDATDLAQTRTLSQLRGARSGLFLEPPVPLRPELREWPMTPGGPLPEGPARVSLRALDELIRDRMADAGWTQFTRRTKGEPMRTLLVASQKGGVGKTTTAVNLAAVAGRSGSRVLLLDADPLGSVTASLQLLREGGDNVPRPDGVTGRGAVWQNVLPGVDVASPCPAYESGEDDLQDFLTRMPSSPVARFYDRVVVDAAPMIGPRPKALMKAADDVMFVQRAEPLSFRTMPAYLELLREVKSECGRCQFRGILLTLPPGAGDANKATESIRSKFKGLLPVTVPFTSDVNQALVLGQPVVDSHPDSAVAKAYEALAIALGLVTGSIARVASAVPTVAQAVEALASNIPAPPRKAVPAGLTETKSDIGLGTVDGLPKPKSATRNPLRLDPAAKASGVQTKWLRTALIVRGLSTAVGASPWFVVNALTK
jgi:chromosome partitioning protein